MTTSVAASLALTCLVVTVWAADFPAPTKLPQIAELPDPLIAMDGTRVATKEDWQQKRRPELKKLFEHYQYGKYPTLPTKVTGNVVHEDRQAFAGIATLREIEISLGIEGMNPLYVLLVTPNQRSGPVAAFVGMNFCGNHCFSNDEKVRIPSAWIYDRQPGVEKNRATAAGRGKQMDVWPLAMIAQRGYAVATLYSGDVEPDRNDVREGIGKFFPQGEDHTARIMAWAWGIHRVLDHLLTLPEIDSKRIAVVGHSRLGKTALLAGAFDDRIALVIPHQAGCGGTAPSRNDNPKAETVKRINTSFQYWFCPRFKEFNDEPSKLPMDQHSLVALCAPRPVLFTNAVEDEWANPAGQFSVLRAAMPVYRFLGVEGIEATHQPAPGKLIDSRLGYFIRPGPHSMTTGDWETFLAFAGKWLK